MRCPPTVVRDQGNVIVEFVGLVVCVMVPLAFVASSLWSVAVTQLALHNSTHGASRAYVLSETVPIAKARVAAVTSAAMSRYGIPGTTVRTVIRCSTSNCLVPGAYVTVTSSRMVTVRLPVIGARTVTVSASDTAVVDVSR